MYELIATSAVIAGALFLVWLARQPDWQRLRHPKTLELWRFAALRDSQATPASSDSYGRTAEIRCAFCNYAKECSVRLREGVKTPVDECPNSRSIARPSEESTQSELAESGRCGADYPKYARIAERRH